MNVGQLREQLERFPDYYPVVVEVIVGGDLVTADTDLEEVKSDGYDSVRLVPADSGYDVLGLLDEALEAHARAEERRET